MRTFRFWLAIYVILSFWLLTDAQAQQIKSGGTIYIEPHSGDENFIAAALAKEHVPLVVVTDKQKADYILKAEIRYPCGDQGNQQGVINNSVSIGACREVRLSAAITVENASSDAVVFANSSGGLRISSAVNHCAKELKKFIESSEKHN